MYVTLATPVEPTRVAFSPTANTPRARAADRVVSPDKLAPLALLRVVDSTVPAESPPATAELEAWQAYDKASSAALRPSA